MAVRIVSSRRAAELSALAEGLEVYARHREAEEAEWEAIAGLPPAYRVGVALVRKPTTAALRRWEASARWRASLWA